MKKMKIYILVTLLYLITISNNLFASNDIKVIVDGYSKEFTPEPLIQDGTTLVPMRDCFETLGCRIYWDPITSSAIASRDEIIIKVTIGQSEAFVNGNKIYLNVTPQIIGESTYVPLRFVGECLGAEVKWDGTTRTVTILNKTKEELNTSVLSDTQKYEMKTTFSFVNNGDKVSANFNILVGAISSSPYQQDISFDIQPSPIEIYDDDFGNKHAKIKVEEILPGQKLDVVITKKIQNSAIKYNIDEKNEIEKDFELENLKLYTSPQIYTESDNPVIIRKAIQLSKDENNPYLIAKNVFGFVNSYLTYDTNELYARKGALSALETGRGLCEDYSKLFVALLRANDIPSRSVFGFWITDENKKNINYNDWYDLKDIPHEWPEFYLNGFGWIIAEPTFTYTINNIKEVPWNEFANQDSNGHIILGYEPNEENVITWGYEGYGELKLVYNGMKTEIRKVK